MDYMLQNNPHIMYQNVEGVEFVQFKKFLQYSHLLTHCFTTRRGGVSINECTSLNLGFNRNDQRENVLENYKRLSKALRIDYHHMVFSNQVHDNKIKIVDENDRGKGIIKESDIKGYDGLITNQKQVVLVTFYADCVPVFFLDPVREVVASAHSGWRGTVKEISKAMISLMQKNYHCETKDIIAAIGPSIGQCCFEVGQEVYEEFIGTLDWANQYCHKKSETKWHIDLQAVIKHTLENSGLPDENIVNSGICTKCNKDVFFSHRGDQGKTGSLAAIMQLN